MTNLDSILKSRNITLPTKVHLVKAMIFPVVMYGCESWTVKKAECWKIDAFELWCWRRLLRVLWAARRSNQSILNEISPGCSLEGLMLKLKLQYLATSCEQLTHWERPWCWEGLGAGEEGGNRGWDGWMASPTWWAWVWVNSRSWWWTGRPGVLWFIWSQRVRHDWATELNWWRPTRPSRNNIKKRCPFHYKGLECKSRESRDTCSNKQIWSWSTKWSRSKANKVVSRQHTGYSKHPPPTTQEKTLHMDITRWSVLKSDWLYSLQPKMEKLKQSAETTPVADWLRLWTPYRQIHT